MTDEQPEVALYARVSTGMQAEEGKSLDAQIAEMREFAEMRHWKVVSEFIDAGETGTDLDRPGLTSALEAAGKGVYDILLVHEMSRLSRSLYDTLSIFEQLGKWDVGFASVKDPDFDLSNPAGNLMLTVLAALNQYYVDLLKMHTAKAKRERARRGLYNASTTPYGYRHVGDADTPPEIVPDEAEVVREMFERYVTGKESYRDIADWINDAGHRTRSGRRFSKDTIADMLRNPFYKGKVVYKRGEHGQEAGEIYDGQHEPLVSEELWELCRKTRERRRGAPRSYQSQYRVYLLNGIVHCDVCGRKLRAQGAQSGDYYREMSGQRGFVDCPNAGRGVRAEEIDDQVGAVFRRVTLPPDWQQDLAEMMEEDEDWETLENRRARLVAERKRLKRMCIKGHFDDDSEMFDKELARIRRQLAELPSPSDLKAMEHAAAVIEELSEVWDEAEKEDRRDLLRLALRDVKVDVPQGQMVTLEPYPVFVPLMRKVPFLRETEFGVFRPVWPPDIVEALDVMPRMVPVEALPEPESAPDWPLVLDLPLDIEGKRITPLLSDWLKERRRAEQPLGPVVALRNPRVPPLKVDQRHWDTSIERIDDLSEAADDSAAFLWTPFTLQRRKDKEGLIAEVERVLQEAGRWVVVDVLPSAMAGHWLYRYFPAAWENDCGMTWDAFDLYNVLRERGFTVELERKSLYQPVTLGTARAMARRREASSQLALLPDVVYEQGLERLEKALEREGTDHLVSSEVCLVVIQAEA